MNYKDVGNYKNYQEYVEGKEWKEIKDFFYANCGQYKCGICPNHWRLVLHKRSYEFLTMKALYKRFWFKFLVVWYLKKYMVWLCFPHNGQVHFKNGKPVPLEYETLLEREEEVRWMYYRSRILKVRPSDLFRAIGKVLNSL